MGGTRESVNGCLRNWQRNGIVQITEGSIIITNRPALEQMAEPLRLSGCFLGRLV
jgi:Crp-like helix-turn-helix protein